MLFFNLCCRFSTAKLFILTGHLPALEKCNVQANSVVFIVIDGTGLPLPA